MASKLLLLLCVLGLLLIPLKVYGHAGIPYTHDGENHLARFANYKQALREGQLPPRFAPNLMNRYGYPVFNYNYPLPSILSLPLTILGFSYIFTFKIMASSAVVLGALGLYFVINQKTESISGILMAEGIYLLNPYLIGAILYRGSIGEVLSIALFPWLWWSIRQNKTPNPSYHFLAVSGLWMAFLLAHNVGALIGGPLLMLIAFSEYQFNREAWLRLLRQLGVGIGLSLWFWIPALGEKSAVVLDQAGLSTTAIHHFPTITQLLFAPQQFGFSYPGSIDTLSFSLGALQILAALFLFLLWLENKISRRKKSPSTHVNLFLMIILILGQLSLSSPLWTQLPLIRFIQFPWRLSMFLSLIIAVTVASEWSHFRLWIRYILIGGLLFQCIYFWRLQAVDYRYHSDADYDAFAQSTTTANENLPKEFKYLNLGDWQPTPRILDGDGEILVEFWTGSDRSYTLSLTQPSTVVEPTMQYLGWRTTIESAGTSMPADYINDSTIAGRIAYRLESGQYRIRTRFTQQTPARIIGNGVSLLTTTGLILWVTQQVLFGKRSRT